MVQVLIELLILIKSQSEMCLKVPFELLAGVAKVLVLPWKPFLVHWGLLKKKLEEIKMKRREGWSALVSWW